MDFGLFLELLLSIPKTLYFNLKHFPLKVAIKIPILINRRTKLANISGDIILPEKITFGLVKIGFSGSYALGGASYFENRGKIVIKGKATFSRGIQLIVGSKGCLEIGSDFRCNANCIINVGNQISFGNDCLLSWNIMILDGDGHKIYFIDDSSMKMKKKQISVGNHVWICANSTILKGATIADNSIVAAGTTVSKELSQKNILITENNKIVKKNINWKD